MQYNYAPPSISILGALSLCDHNSISVKNLHVILGSISGHYHVLVFYECWCSIGIFVCIVCSFILPHSCDVDFQKLESLNPDGSV